MLARAYLDIVLSPGGLAVFRVVIAEGPRFPKLARTFYLAGPQVMTTMVSEQLANERQRPARSILARLAATRPRACSSTWFGANPSFSA
jgi:hypothetical protein